MPARWPWQNDFTTILDRDPRAPRPDLTAPAGHGEDQHTPATPAALTPARKPATPRSRPNAHAPTSTNTNARDGHTPLESLEPN